MNELGGIGRLALRYLGHVFAGALLPSFGYMLAVIYLDGFFPFLRQPTILGLSDDPPFFIVQVGLAAVLGVILNARKGRRSATFVWIPALLWLAYFIASEFPIGLHTIGVKAALVRTLDDYFTGDCGASECIGAFVATLPFYTAVAYSLAAWLMYRRRGRAQHKAGEQSGVA